MRRLLVLLHRWFGLGAALLLMIAGLTGAVIAWHVELDAWLNPSLHEQRSAGGARLDPLTLAERVEAADARLLVTYLPLHVEAGRALQMGVEPRIDARTGEPFELGFEEIAVDPATGEVQGRRSWEELSWGREHWIPFLYELHYSLHLPGRQGVWLMGLLAMAWLLDAFVALWISFPSRAGWRKSFRFRWSEGGHKRTFDLHRSGGVWLWLLFLPLAVSAVSLSLSSEVVRPLLSTVSTLSPSPFEGREPSAERGPVLGRAQVVSLARAEAVRQGLQAPLGAISYAPEANLYGVGFFEPEHERGAGLGNPWLYLDAVTGALVARELPGQGSAGDVFLQLQFPLHSGRILGIGGRVVVSALGLALALSSATGVLLWARRRRARVLAAARAGVPERGGAKHWAPAAPGRLPL